MMRPNRPICRLCECPVVDGGVQASEIDEEKFDEWCLNVLDSTLADNLRRGDVICNFCVWDCEFDFLHNGVDSSLAWWPVGDERSRQSKFRTNYLDELLKPCWVELEKITLPESDEEDEEVICKPMQEVECIYCGELLPLKIRSNHMIKRHKNVAIRCEKQKCGTYFHTIRERENHMENVHEKPKELKVYKCIYCKNKYAGINNFRQHVRNVHSKIEIKCAVFGCISYFTTQDDLDSHNKFLHNHLSKCGMCKFVTSTKHGLISHISQKHLLPVPKTIKCEKCPNLYSSESRLQQHMKISHTSKVCNICQSNVSLKKFRHHFQKLKCCRCQVKFPCSGKLNSHLLSCRTSRKCKRCPHLSFETQSALKYHNQVSHHAKKEWKKKQPKWKGLKYENLGMKCESCKRYFSTKITLKKHFETMHGEASVKFCAHCPLSFRRTDNLIYHLGGKHNLIEKKHKCLDCEKSFMVKNLLERHMKISHLGKN